MKKCLSGLLVLLPLILIACDQGTDPGTKPSGKDTLTNPQDTLTNPTDTVTVPLDTTVYRSSDGNSIRRDYEPLRSRLQITRIYFNQNYNKLNYGINDEWVVLESNTNMRTSGWKLDAADGQIYPLPDTVYRKLYIYSNNGPGYDNDTIMRLRPDTTVKWIWNNAEPDTGKLWNADGKLVDFMTYDPKP